MILTFDTPKKARTTEEHNKMFTSDSMVPGTFVPNMSKTDMYKWKAKHIKGEDERIEIRKTIGGTQLLVIVYKNTRQVKWNGNNRNEWSKRHNHVRMSMNGPLDMTIDDYKELRAVIEDAEVILGVHGR